MNPLTCQPAVHAASDQLARLLSDAERDALQKHLGGCDVARASWTSCTAPSPSSRHARDGPHCGAEHRSAPLIARAPLPVATDRRLGARYDHRGRPQTRGHDDVGMTPRCR